MISPDLPLILIAWIVAGASPGPATLAIAGTAMRAGRWPAICLATGVVVGSATWGIAAGLGLSALMQGNVWIMQGLRYFGAGYLLYLAMKSLISAVKRGPPVSLENQPSARAGAQFAKGLLIHLTNPKAILSWAAVYTIAVAPGAGPAQIFGMFLVLISASVVIFLGYALVFSNAAIATWYLRARRGLELAFAVFFGAAALKLFSVGVSSR